MYHQAGSQVPEMYERPLLKLQPQVLGRLFGVGLDGLQSACLRGPTFWRLDKELESLFLQPFLFEVDPFVSFHYLFWS